MTKNLSLDSLLVSSITLAIGMSIANPSNSSINPFGNLEESAPKTLCGFDYQTFKDKSENLDYTHFRDLGDAFLVVDTEDDYNLGFILFRDSMEAYIVYMPPETHGVYDVDNIEKLNPQNFCPIVRGIFANRRFNY